MMVRPYRQKNGKYAIINKIGKGSTGMVHLSHDPYYCRDVVIKVYNSEKDADADRARVNRKIFFNEAHMFVCCGIRTSYRFTTLVKKRARITL